MDEAAGSMPGDDPDVAPIEVVVGRSIGGIVLVIVGVAIALGCAFMVFIAPFLGGDLANWAELGELYWIPGVIGLVIAGGGVTMVRRARKRSLDEPVDVAAPDDGGRSAAPPGMPPGMPPKSIL